MKILDHSKVLQIISPNPPSPVILDSPHSGMIHPDDFQPHCATEDLNSITDRYVDLLFQDAPKHGATLITALFSRSYIDVNRARDDIDNLLYSENWPEDLYGKTNPSIRSSAGIGIIPRLIKPGLAVYKRPLQALEIMNRIRNYYDPYHQVLAQEIENSHSNFGQSFHINCHSMPNSSAFPKRQNTTRSISSDIVLGNRDGTTCDRDFLHLLRDFWQNHGYRVTINDPFKGVELISAYSQPTRGKHSVQLEINRSLYMDEKTGEKIETFGKLKNHCSDMVKTCTEYTKKFPMQRAKA